MPGVVIALLVLMISGLGGCNWSGTADGDRGGKAIGDRTLRFAINRISDCAAINDYPYARDLFCPAAFSAAQTMVSALADSFGAEPPRRGFFYYYQTRADPQSPADDQSQTTVACGDIRAPWRDSAVVGAGAPLCRLIAYATSPGPVAPGTGSDELVPDTLSVLPQYFSRLLAPDLELRDEFRPGAGFDTMVRGLGAAAHDRFVADYPSFSSQAVYDPGNWASDPQYHGISGGGGGGWGGEIGIERGDADLVLLAFGGGRGAGMTSIRTAHGTLSRVGAGGGGGMQFADGYRFEDRAYDGLGVGAGMGSDEHGAQYSYFDYAAADRPSQPAHEYNPEVLEDYRAQLGNLRQQLTTALAAGAIVVLRGGGGMGAGTEYLSATGEEFAPHALSTQAGFQFRYEFASTKHIDATPDAAAPERDDDTYAQVGDFYRQAAMQAYVDCGRDYANFDCICPTTHSIVVCLMARLLGDGANLPGWLRQQHCPNAPMTFNRADRLRNCDQLLDERVASTDHAP